MEGICPTALPSVTGKKVTCPPGGGTLFDQWDCLNVDLLSFIPLIDLGSSNEANGNDIWGWTAETEQEQDESGGIYFTITGQTDGSSIVDVTDPINPIVLCFIPSQVETRTTWRDIKIAENSNGIDFAFVVADREGMGLQWFPMAATINKCRNNKPDNSPFIMTSGIDFGWVGSNVMEGDSTNVHNVVGNDANNKIYLVGSGGSRGDGTDSCNGGLNQVNVDSLSTTNFNIEPQYSGCFKLDGYTHDAECITYDGPDIRYIGREICFGYNQNSITVIDFTDSLNPEMISRIIYPDYSAYTHQGWINPDQIGSGIEKHRFVLMNDELDESQGTVTTQTTYIVDYKSLTDPIFLVDRNGDHSSLWNSGIISIDHNLYIRGSFVYQANYRAGLRINQIIPTPGLSLPVTLQQTGFFKTWIGEFGVSFNGAWSNYPYFGIGSDPIFVVVQDIETGLFVLDVSNAVNTDNNDK